MNLPQIVSKLIEAQNNFDSKAYAECFAETAIVVDEGHTYNGREEILNWIYKANQQYNIMMEPIDYSELEQVMNAEISGNFPGSPAILSYRLKFTDGLIQSLSIG